MNISKIDLDDKHIIRSRDIPKMWSCVHSAGTLHNLEAPAYQCRFIILGNAGRTGRVHFYMMIYDFNERNVRVVSRALDAVEMNTKKHNEEETLITRITRGI